MTIPQDSTCFELVEALSAAGAASTSRSASNCPAKEEPACAVCRLVERSVAQCMRSFFAEFVNDPRCRETLRKARGFCSGHAALLAELGDALAVAILYGDLADQTRMRWMAGVGRPRFGKPRLNGSTRVPCPACGYAEEAERRYTRALADNLGVEAVWQALVADDGLCVAHAEQTMALAKPEHAASFRDLQAGKLAVLQAELEEIVRKNDYRFRGEPWGAEKDAWLRALRKITRP